MTQSTIATQYRVSELQMSMAHRVVDMVARQIFFICESASQPGVEYKVIYNRQLKVLQCLPFTGEPCKASQHGLTCWHMRASCAVAAEYKAQQEADMEELHREMQAECCTPYTVAVDETSSSLDGVTFEVRNGRSIPMR